MSNYNKIAIVILAASAMISGSVMAAAPKTATAMATWSATAIKDTTSDLVVTPLGSLTFNYATGIKGFNTQKGLFDVSITGDDTATAFTLSAEPVNTTLTHLSDGSTLNVGVEWYGKKLAKGTEEPLIDATNSGNGLSAIGAGAIVSGQTSAQDSFNFRIDSAVDGAGAPVTDMTKLADGIWSGDVSVRFVADWAK